MERFVVATVEGVAEGRSEIWGLADVDYCI